VNVASRDNQPSPFAVAPLVQFFTHASEKDQIGMIGVAGPLRRSFLKALRDLEPLQLRVERENPMVQDILGD